MVENIRCGGCVASITDKLKKNHQASEIVIDIEAGKITLNSDDNYDAIASTLLALGYPKVGTVEGFNKAKTKTKSVVSCAIGKFK